MTARRPARVAYRREAGTGRWTPVDRRHSRSADGHPAGQLAGQPVTRPVRPPVIDPAGVPVGNEERTP